jgi:hypothetical protein
MKKTAGGGISSECRKQQDTADSILSDLISLTERLHQRISFSESAMAMAATDEEAVADGFYILDDVTPRHAMANAALNACDAALGEALCHLLEAKMSEVSPGVARAA